MTTFNQELKLANQQKLWQHRLQRIHQETSGERIYLSFCNWCFAFANESTKTDAKAFAKFLKQENIKLTFWQRKNLAEKYFGYKYEYKHEKGDWEITKIKA